MTSPTTAALYAVAVDERYRVLRLALVIARKRSDWGLRLDQAEAIRAEKRALVRVRWFVRRETRRQVAARAAVMSLPYHDWQSLPETIDALRGPSALTEPELLAGYGVRP